MTIESDMLRWGAILLCCPQCKIKTPMYRHTIFGGDTCVPCQHCGARLQYINGEAVFAQLHTADRKTTIDAEKAGLAEITIIAHSVMGISKDKLNLTLREILEEIDGRQ